MVAIQRVDGGSLANPAGHDELCEGDTALVFGTPEQIAAALPFFRSAGRAALAGQKPTAPPGSRQE